MIIFSPFCEVVYDIHEIVPDKRDRDEQPKVLDLPDHVTRRVHVRANWKKEIYFKTLPC